MVVGRTILALGGRTLFVYAVIQFHALKRCGCMTLRLDDSVVPICRFASNTISSGWPLTQLVLEGSNLWLLHEVVNHEQLK